MKFTNPWIDPRVQHVRVQDAERYLVEHGWKRVPFPREEVHLFAGPIADDGQPITQPVPANEKGAGYVQSIIDLITNLAILEDRTAAAALDDMLAKPDAGHSENGGNQTSRSKKRRTAG